MNSELRQFLRYFACSVAAKVAAFLVIPRFLFGLRFPDAHDYRYPECAALLLLLFTFVNQWRNTSSYSSGKVS